MGKDVEDLEVFRRAYALSLELHRASLKWPSAEQHGGIASQVRRSSKSVCALLVEGAGRLRRSRLEFGRYLVMALASADETRLWCRYAEDLGYTAAAIRQRSRRRHGVMPMAGSRACCRACWHASSGPLLLITDH